jgi:hypothetical protein
MADEPTTDYPPGAALDERDIHGDRSGYPKLIGRKLRVIAFAGRANDWAAYAGEWWWPSDTIHDIGVKLRLDVAAAFFPELDPGRYRE